MFTRPNRPNCDWFTKIQHCLYLLYISFLLLENYKPCSEICGYNKLVVHSTYTHITTFKTYADYKVTQLWCLNWSIIIHIKDVNQFQIIVIYILKKTIVYRSKMTFIYSSYKLNNLFQRIHYTGHSFTRINKYYILNIITVIEWSFRF